MKEITAEELTNAGERMIVGNMWGYWAHLSIYTFARQHCAGKRVLDVGCGAGYGSSYLAEAASSVLGLDGGETAIEHCRKTYPDPNLMFEFANLDETLDLKSDTFDVVFSSNVFEHVGNIDNLISECARVMAPDGLTFVAVPPICSAKTMAADMENQFHVHHIPPTAWRAKLSRFFEDVRCFGHGHNSKYENCFQDQMALPPDQVTIRETDFIFPETTAVEMEINEPVTAIFLCRKRREYPNLETLEERTPQAWREGEAAANLFAKLLRDNNNLVGTIKALELDINSKAELYAQKEAQFKEEIVRLRRENVQQEERIATVYNSMSWRLTAPFRNLRLKIDEKWNQ